MADQQKSPTRSYQLIGDIVLVRHIGKNIESTLLHIPESVRSKSGGILAEVVDWGFVPHQRRKIGKHKNKKVFICDELNYHWKETGNRFMKVIVPQHLGTRKLFPKYPDLILYDGEDVLAIVDD